MKDHAEKIVRAAHLLPHEEPKGDVASWRFSDLKGQLIELSEEIPFGALTFTSELILAAQQADEPVGWISARSSIFYPPDMAENGVDISAITVVSVSDEREAAWTCDLLIRSGAFGFVVVDLEAARRLTDAAVARLIHLSRRHGTVVLFLTVAGAGQPSLSSLVSLRGVVRRRSATAGRGSTRPSFFFCEVTTVKDKHRAPGRKLTRRYDGPIGVC
jgi:recombination protein RecA